ncbi:MULTISPECIES: patatin-like phospholipase family protein [Bradyrhizobium]|uniref:patatin-like phospholipase family protein n=1 Tax=Bradyrhizobium TaxID=374 RepID=UPI00155E25B6|nr:MULTISPECIES: patatin-like phospholipase family protein [unclassified Bradyrhizobium]NRB90103.1 patatin [Bradyrhizobium sp. WBAH10]QCJ93031.1 patatin [Bradyrhizobium yuanmingense]MDD1520770.1 patatin [Bradyrhizobium sp. WBAH30]MDD1545821.1 patatin [Bradyrhizobium sp. WBAH41]MDD1558918.1 patatin [Bradyrhizobium sp. WBAH23]
MRRSANLAPLLATLLTTLLVAGCAALAPRNALPEAAAAHIDPDGFHNIRYWGDEATLEAAPLEPGPDKASEALKGYQAGRPLNFLAISGGAEDGAFGAGLLAGWGDAGRRPTFHLVTGVSSGALIAPFVFLGRERDGQLRDIFTNYGRRDIFAVNVPSLLGGSGLVDSSPLAHLIEKYVDAEFLREVARERSKGRVLLIGTTNLDAQRPVLWDMGRIAASDSPEALDLFRKVLLASATLPGVFAPVRMKVLIGGKEYDELHVDGGVTRQVFIPQSILRLVSGSQLQKLAVGARLYVIRNGRIQPQWEPVKDNVLAISQRSLSTLIKNQSIGDLYRIYTITRMNGIEFNLASIPSDFQAQSNEPFNLTYMRALFDRGFDMGRRGYPWIKSLPGLQTAARQPSSGL